MSSTESNVLIIGASGRTGKYLVEALAKQRKDTVNIYAFCRQPTNLEMSTRQYCANVIQGNARNEKDLNNAIVQSKADFVVVAVGNGDDVNIQRDAEGFLGHTPPPEPCPQALGPSRMAPWVTPSSLKELGPGL